MENLLIWDVDGPPPTTPNTTILWRAISPETLPRCISIPRLVEERADFIKARYLAWIYDLGELRLDGHRLIDCLGLRDNFSYWWMTLISEKCNFDKSPLIVDVIRMIAFTHLVEGCAIRKVTLVSENRALAECFEGWCKQSSIIFDLNFRTSANQKSLLSLRIFQSFPRVLKATVWLVHYVATRWKFRAVGLEQWRRTSGQITFVSYLFNTDHARNVSKAFNSVYWGNLPEVLASDGQQTNWLHVYVRDNTLMNASAAAGVVDGFNQNAKELQTHAVLDTFLTFHVVLSALKDWCRILWLSRSLEKHIAVTDKSGFWPLLKNDWYESVRGVSAVSNLLSFNLFESAMRSMPVQRVGVFLQENQGWELGFTHAWQSAGHGVLIGAPHSSVRFWDLRYFSDPRVYLRTGVNCMPLPCRVALNGDAAMNQFIVGEYPRSNLVEVEALRYLHLENAIEEGASKSLMKFNYKLRILVFGDYLESITRKQMSLLATALQFYEAEIEVIVKPHPACPIDPHDYPSLGMTLELSPICKLLEQCDAAYASGNTSAALDSYCYGVPIASILDPTTLNMSPLRGYEGIVYVSTPEELREFFRSVKRSYRPERKTGGLLTIDRGLHRWRALLNTREIIEA